MKTDALDSQIWIQRSSWLLAHWFNESVRFASNLFLIIFNTYPMGIIDKKDSVQIPGPKEAKGKVNREARGSGSRL